MALFVAWLALRFGELAELWRSDVDLDAGVVNVRRGVVRTSKGRKVKDPSRRPASDVLPSRVPPPRRGGPPTRAYCAWHDGLLFSAGHGEQLTASTLYKVYCPARGRGQRADLRSHALRHTGAVLIASTGATLAELMTRLGHSTPGAARRYQNAADALSELVTSKVASGLRSNA